MNRASVGVAPNRVAYILGLVIVLCLLCAGSVQAAPLPLGATATFSGVLAWSDDGAHSVDISGSMEFTLRSQTPSPNAAFPPDKVVWDFAGGTSDGLLTFSGRLDNDWLFAHTCSAASCFATELPWNLNGAWDTSSINVSESLSGIQWDANDYSPALFSNTSWNLATNADFLPTAIGFELVSFESSPYRFGYIQLDLHDIVPVPEPSSLWLLGSAVGLAVACRRRWRPL
jgi:hypothetical protein